MKLRPPETAPKTGTVILAHFGYPWLMPAAWNEYDEEWAICTVQACPMSPDGKHDTYWESEREKPGALTGWMPMPKIPPLQNKGK